MSYPNDPSPRPSAAMTGTSLPECQVLEIFDEMVGLLIPAERGCVFHAVVADAWPLDGCSFPTPYDAKLAVRELMVVKRRASLPPELSARQAMPPCGIPHPDPAG